MVMGRTFRIVVVENVFAYMAKQYNLLSRNSRELYSGGKNGRRMRRRESPDEGLKICLVKKIFFPA